MSIHLNRTSRIMLLVLACLVPGTLISVWYLGPGILVNIVVSVLTALLIEFSILKLRTRDWRIITDGSAIVTAVLLALALPPDLPIWMVVFGSGIAMVFGKHLYGGLGNNPFNPAMVGYAALIVYFPLAMSSWPALADGLSGATVLDSFKFRGGQTVDEFWRLENGVGYFGGFGYEWINLGFLVGGIGLIILRAARWQAPFAMLLTLCILSVLFYDSGSSNSLGSPLFHLFSGGTMLAAFFIVTDPVTSPDTNIGLYVFGAGVGLLTFIIRSMGAYPDGFAFAILLMNAMTPLWEQVRLQYR